MKRVSVTPVCSHAAVIFGATNFSDFGTSGAEASGFRGVYGNGGAITGAL